MKANQKSINLYNSAAGAEYGKDVTFYDAKGHAVEVVEIVNAEELAKAGINFDVGVTNGEGSKNVGSADDMVRIQSDSTWIKL